MDLRNAAEFMNLHSKRVFDETRGRCTVGAIVNFTSIAFSLTVSR